MITAFSWSKEISLYVESSHLHYIVLSTVSSAPRSFVVPSLALRFPLAALRRVRHSSEGKGYRIYSPGIPSQKLVSNVK